MTSKGWEIPVENLRTRFDARHPPFATTEELSKQEGLTGQERAVRAVEFGQQIQGQVYNIYVSRAQGTGKNILVRGVITQVAQTQPIPANSGHAARTKRLDGLEACPQKTEVTIEEVGEASHLPRQEDKAYVDRRHVRRALEERIYPSSPLAERPREPIAEGIPMVDMAGSMVGKSTPNRSPTSETPPSLSPLASPPALQTASESRQAKRRRRTSLPETHLVPAGDAFHPMGCFVTGRGHGPCCDTAQMRGDVVLVSRSATIIGPSACGPSMS